MPVTVSHTELCPALCIARRTESFTTVRHGLGVCAAWQALSSNRQLLLLIYHRCLFSYSALLVDNGSDGFQDRQYAEHHLYVQAGHANSLDEVMCGRAS